MKGKERDLGSGYSATYHRGYWEVKRDGVFVGNVDEGELFYEVEQDKEEAAKAAV